MLKIPTPYDLSNKSFYHLIAKSGQRQQRGWLPLWAHLLDTAGVMELLVSEWCPHRPVEARQVTEREWTQACVFLALVHDIGKCTPVFQSKIKAQAPELGEILQGCGMEIPTRSSFLEPDKTPHGVSGEAILLHFGCPPGAAAVVGAHHGRPQEIGDDVEDWLELYEENFYGPEGKESADGTQWETLWQDWLSFALDACGCSRIDELPRLDVPAQMLASGLLIMADWIASNATYFPLLELEDMGNSLAWPARIRVGWERLSLPRQWRPDTCSMDEQEFRSRFGFTWNAVQQEMIQAVEESARPGIFILEAQMGVGKTEAALAAAELMGGRLGCAGLFFGLPTQATANGIFPRLKQWAQGQSERVRHGIRLAHGMADLNEDYQAVFHGRAAQNEDGAPSGLVVHPWFEGRKQALLSEFVIGTVDQILMSALKQKHIMLRHLGLAGKVVVVDECHAYDAYMNRYLDRALNWLGRYGVPVILLSATLPSRRRRELILAYQNKMPEEEARASGEEQSYPLLTWTDGGQVRQKRLRTDRPPRLVQMRRAEERQLCALVGDAAAKGGCVGVIVNTVHRAQEVAQELRRGFPENPVILIHARLLMGDRSEREAELLRSLGKRSTPERRRGLIVVGTQILEQSLDIDFDFMITQLCPMDLLLQRIGRLHRHERRRPAGLEEAACVVLDQNDPDDGTKAVYGKWLLYRTAQLLPEQIVLPDDISPLVQQTYREGDEALPEGDPALALWQEYRRTIMEQEGRAQAFRIPDADDLDETIHGLLDAALGDSEWVSQASVRDGAPGLEVLVMERRASGDVAFLPWQYGGTVVPRDHTPSQEECRHILRQRLRLPGALCGRGIERTIAELEAVQRAVVPEWSHAPLLQGELFLFLDAQGRAELRGYQLTYTKEIGLRCARKEEEHGAAGIFSAG